MKAISTICLSVLLAIAARAVAEDQPPAKNLILPGETFFIEGRTAFILWPPEEKRTQPQPWVMYAPTLPAYPDRHEKWIHEQFLNAGVAVAGIDVGEAYGSPSSQDSFSKLHQELVSNRGFHPKPCLFGRSRGGLWVSSWAIRNADKVAGIAGIYPVFDLQTYPGLKRAAPAYGLSPEELDASLNEHNPVSKIDHLAEAEIPICIIHGDVDHVVPLKENSKTVQDVYVKAGHGGSVDLIVARGQGHNFWPGFFHCQNVVDFAIQRAKQKSPKSAEYVQFKDLEYSRPDGQPLHLDLYLPREPIGTSPLVVWVHGGGWKNGSKNRCPATWLVDKGFAVAGINYRLIDRGQWPAQIDDCREAIRWLRKNAVGFGFDGNHIGVWGGSAGGHLVALMGTQPVPDSEEVSSQIQAVCDWYGPTDLLTMPPNVVGNGRTLEQVANSNGAKLLGATVRDVPELAKQASAFHQVSKGDAPFLIMHGDQDPGVPLEQSQKLHDKLIETGVPSTFIVVEGAGHGGKEFQSTENRQTVLDFFNKHLVVP